MLGWPHVQPDGPGQWDLAALDRCDRVLDGLLERGLRPGLTLLHRDLPGWLGASGGWLSRDAALRFADYAAEMGRRFGDRVARWITSTDLGAPSVAECMAGMSPSGRGLGVKGIPAVHHLLLAGGLGAQALAASGVTGEIGTTVGLVGGYPATDDPWDRIAVERLESWGNRLFLDPMLLGEHMASEDGYSPIEESGCVRPGDLGVISTRQDVLGLSWHLPIRVTAPENLPRVLPVLGCFQALNDVNRLLMARVRRGPVRQGGDHFQRVAHRPRRAGRRPRIAVLPVRRPASAAVPHRQRHVRPGQCGRARRGGPGQTPGRAGRQADLAGRRDGLRGGRARLRVLVGAGQPRVEAGLSRLYGAAVPEGEQPWQPPIPRDWARAGAFAEEPGPGAGRPLAVVAGSGAAPVT